MYEYVLILCRFKRRPWTAYDGGRFIHEELVFGDFFLPLSYSWLTFIISHGN